MSNPAAVSGAPTSEAGELERVQELFGGKQMLGRSVRTQLEAHKLLGGGLNAKALHHFIQKNTGTVQRGNILKVIGMSERTYQRHKQSPRKVSPDQSGRAWKFAEILAEATSIFGSQEEAEQWLERPALGLNRQLPIDLLTTPAGARLVTDFLTRLKYGVYT